MTDVFLYAGEANPNNVVLRDPTSNGGAASLTATIAFTLDGITVASSATVGHPATIAATLDTVSTAFAATAGHTATASIVLDDVTAAVAATAGHPASLAVTLDDIVVAMDADVTAGSSSITADIQITLDDISVAFNADVSGEETDVYPGSGYPATGIYWGVKKVKKGKRLDDILKKAMDKIVEGEMELEPETTAAKAVELVKPNIVKPANETHAPEIDWNAVERDMAKVRELLKLWEEEVRLQDDEDVLLLSEW